METADTFAGMFWAYLALWVIIVAYVVSLGRRVSKLEKDQESENP